MSAEAFRKTLNSIPELKYWITGQTKNQSSFLFQTRSSSKDEIRQSIVDHIIPTEQLTQIVGTKTAEAIIAELKQNPGIYSNGIDRTEFLEIKDKNGKVIQTAVIFKDVKFDTLNKNVAHTLEDIAIGAGLKAKGLSTTVLDYVKENSLDKGHIFGWANTLVNRTKKDLKNELSKVITDPEILEKNLKEADKFIDALLDILEEYDILSSDIKGLDSQIFVKYRKTDSAWIIEWQSKLKNQGTGGTVATLLGKSANTGVRSFIKEVSTNTSNSLIENSLKNMVAGFVNAGLTDPKYKLTDLESSPSLKKLFIDTVVSKLSGKRKKYAVGYQGYFKVADISSRTVSGQATAKASIKKAKNNLITLKNKSKVVLEKVKNQSRILKSNVDLISLQTLINSRLHDQIQKNMGTGNDKRVLNYRTGRFAKSVEVERMSESREGMITAFYSYMKNPYATFSAGGRQEYPRTRDPKLLISKSIREIAAEKVTNRLRAVAL